MRRKKREEKAHQVQGTHSHVSSSETAWLILGTHRKAAQGPRGECAYSSAGFRQM